ncbi:MAG: hypothetical protein HZA50_01845 [Planctomycetes bacterium]|nr:hypothetical protein [Planctomycetota bacterium]
MELRIGASAILMLFYLVLLLKPELIKSRLFFMVGAAAILLDILLIGIFGIWAAENWARVLCGILSTIFVFVAFAATIPTCFGGCPLKSCRDDQPQNPPTGPAGM